MWPNVHRSVHLVKCTHIRGLWVVNSKKRSHLLEQIVKYSRGQCNLCIKHNKFSIHDCQ